MQSSLFSGPTKARQYLYSCAGVLGVALLSYFFSDFIGYRVVAFLLLLVVSITAVVFDILPVLLAASLSAFIWDFFFIPPKFHLHVGTTEDSILLLMYFVIAIIHSILTYKIRQAERISRLKEERANSVTLYNTILDSLSHELRTPIAAIIGATDNLQSNTNLQDGQKQQLLNEISKASLRLNQQIENLLNISRLESGHIAPKLDWVDIPELLYEVVKKVEDNGRGRKVHVNVNPEMPFCYTDKGMLDQILYNLLNNASIHTAPSCRIDLSVNCNVDLLEAIVEDSGKGFTPAERRQLFAKFSRENRKDVGASGLGLSIVQGFTSALSGHVEVAAAASGGAKFIVTIPVKTSLLLQQ